MKPLSLKITAFGPYAKQTTLNFKEDLDGQDIFVVTGPTGAGKTTIFDAICYALYGETSGGSRTGKELRSDFAKDSELKTEVEFSFRVKDKTYQITRAPQQLQKKKRGDGFREVPATVELLEVGSEQAPITKDGEVKEQIQQIIGLKVEQFRKIVMIPQGDFKEFLLANTTNKEEILRKIFGTDFYKTIQEQLTQQANALKLEVADTQKSIQAELKLIKTDEEHVIELEQPLTNVLAIAKDQQAVWKASANTLTEMSNRLDEMIQEHRTHHEAGMRLNEKFTQYEQVIQTLEQLNHYQASISEREKQIQEAKSAQGLINLENECLKYQVLQQDTATKQQQLMHSLKECETEFILVEKCYTAIESLRQEIASLIQSKSDLARYIEGVTHLEQKCQLLESLKKSGQTLKTELEVEEGRLIVLRQEVSQLEQLTLQLATFKDQQHTLNLKQLKLNEDFEYVQSLVNRLHSYEKTTNLIETQQIYYQQLMSDATTQRHAYEHQAELFINAAAIRLANELKVGQACPVCGSLDHPNPRRSDEKILSKNELDQFRFEVESLENKVRQVQQELTVLQTTQSEEQRSLNELVQTLQGRHVVSSDFRLNQEVADQLSEVLRKETNELVQLIEKVHLDVERLENEIQRLTQLKLEIEPLEQQIDQKQGVLQEQRDRYKAEQRSKKDLEESIPENYRSLDVLNQMMSEVELRKVELEQNISSSEADYQRVTTQIAGLKAAIEEVNQQLAYYIEQFEQSNEAFFEQIQTYFESVERYEEAKQWIELLAQLEQQVQNYYQELHTATKMQEMLQEELKGKDRVDLSVLEEMMAELDRRKAEITKDCATLMANLEQNEMILNSVTKKYQTIQKREQEYAIVGELDSLANGRSGGKMSFETYVLSSYFDEVLAAANARLQKMTSRRYYLLRREEVKGVGRKGLDLDVYDSHTCNNRPVNTLSGGESFKASLALALGLSDTVQQNSGGIQLDTMFIDEGFGTLDSESLDQAIDILMELQDHGRLIGVISHVNELKERIPAKLVVETDGAGSQAYFRK